MVNKIGHRVGNICTNDVFCESYTYDDEGNVISVQGLSEQNSYDGDGNLQRMVDHQRDVTTVYYYDLTGRLIRSVSDNGSEYRYEYDLNNNLTKLHQSAGGSSWTTEYTYDKDNRPVTVTVTVLPFTVTVTGRLSLS